MAGRSFCADLRGLQLGAGQNWVGSDGEQAQHFLYR
jgi:hypothetical protein